MQDASKQSQSGYWVVIPAAGIGSRMQADRPKQYLPLAGKTVLEHTLDCFLDDPRLNACYVAIANDDPYWNELAVRQHQQVREVNGGQERCHSVFNALLHLLPEAADDDWVLVHDAARPCLRKADIDKLIDTLSDDEVGGILAVPVRDTMKRSDLDDQVIGTVDRVQLWHALTPQMFRVGTLYRAIRTALDHQILVTDEASAIELSGLKPRLIEGHSDNIKITRPEDLALAGFFLQQQGRM